MSLVTNVFDHYGMYSKSGRFSIEKFPILQQAHEIMSGYIPKKGIERTMLADLESRIHKIQELNLSNKSGELNLQNLNKKKMIKKASSENKLELESRKNIAKFSLRSPPLGTYNPKFSSIDKKIKGIPDFQRSHKKNKKNRKLSPLKKKASLPESPSNMETNTNGSNSYKFFTELGKNSIDYNKMVGRSAYVFKH